jgi:MFS family permease
MNEPLVPEIEDLGDDGEATSEAPAVPSGSGFLAVLHNRSFVSIWLAQIASQTAQNSLWYTLIILVGNLTGQRPASVGFTIILVQLPTVLFSGLSGVFVDRFSKRLILVGTNIIRVAGVLLYIGFSGNVVGLYLVTFFVAVVSQPFAPAEGSALPLLVKQEQLITANSLFQMTFMASQAVGFALSPIAIGVFGMRTTLFALAGLFAFSAVVLVPLPAVTDRRAPTDSRSIRETAVGVWRDLTEVFRYIIGDPPLMIALFQIALAPTLLLVLAEIGPDYLKHGLHIGNTSTSLFFLLAPAGVGLAAGMAILGQWGYRLKKDRLVLISLISLGISVIGLASVPAIGGFWTSLSHAGFPIPAGVGLTGTMVPIAVLMGIEVAFINAPVQTIVQQRAPAHLRGRVLAMQQTLSAAMAIPPLILVGAVASIVGTPATLVLMGLLMVIIGLATVYYL